MFFSLLKMEKRYRYHEHRGVTQFCVMPVVNQLYIYIYIYIYIRKRSGPEIDPCGTPQVISPASEKTFSSVTVKFFCLRDMIEAILNRLLKIIASIFCKSMV